MNIKKPNPHIRIRLEIMNKKVKSLNQTKIDLIICQSVFSSFLD